MDRLFRTNSNKKTNASPGRYEPPRVQAFKPSHQSPAAPGQDSHSSSSLYNNAPPRVNAYVHATSSSSAYDTYEMQMPPRVEAYVPSYSTPSYDMAPNGPAPAPGVDIHIYEPYSTAYGKTNTTPVPVPVAVYPDYQEPQQPPKRPKPTPPSNLLVEPFGGAGEGASTVGLTPIIEDGESAVSPSIAPANPNTDDSNDTNADKDKDKTQKARQREKDKKRAEELKKRPTCSLSLVCYSRGCSMSQIRVTKRSKYDTEYDFESALAKEHHLVTNDEQLFRKLGEMYTRDMCGFWRRWLSLKTLKRLRLLSYTETTRPTPVPLDEFTMAEVLYAYNHPSDFASLTDPSTDWIDWVFRLRQPSKRHALEFVEGWNGTRIAIVGTIPCVISTLIGVIWVARGGDAQTAFTVASFILTLCTVLLALLAVISGIDSKAN